MHEVLRQRLLRRIESLPESQIYQVLDFIEFLESKYANERAPVEPSMLQKFAEGLEDRMRKKAMNPANLREAFQLISAADKVLSDVSSAGKQIMDDLGNLGEPPPAGPGRSGGRRANRKGGESVAGARSRSEGRGGSSSASTPASGSGSSASAGPDRSGRSRERRSAEKDSATDRSPHRASAGEEDPGLGEEWSPPAGGTAGEGRGEA